MQREHLFRTLIVGWCIGGGFWSGPVLCRGVHAAEPSQLRADAVQRGLRWLVTAQQEDGSWGSRGFRGSVAVTAQGMLAVFSAGSTPAAGPHAESSRRAASYLRRHGHDDGLIAANEAAAHGPMYGHAFATLALAESWGELADPRLVDVLVRSSAFIAGTQSQAGGWRYQPIPGDADISVTASMLVALRGLVLAGVDVDAATAEQAVGYILALQNEDGGFRYMQAAGPSASPRTAAALFALQLAGVQGAVIEQGFAWLDQHPISLDDANGYALYGLAASASARWQRRLATDDQAAWTAWFEPVARSLVDHQREDGSWTDPSCPEYGTAAAISILQTPAGLLPIVAAEGRRSGAPE